jgi:hypothetical protein
VHPKQKHFCEGFVPRHAFVDLRGFHPSIRCGHGDHSLMNRKSFPKSVPSGISQANFLGHRPVISRKYASYPFRSPRDGGSAKSSKFQLILAA